MSQLTLPEFSQGRWLLLASTLCRQSPYWTWKCWGKGSVSWKKKSWELLKLLAPGGSSTRTAPEMLQYSPLLKKWVWGSWVLQLPKNHAQKCSEVVCTHLPGTATSTDLMTLWNPTESPNTLHFQQDKSNYSSTWSQTPWEWFIQLLGCCQTILHFHSLDLIWFW